MTSSAATNCPKTLDAADDHEHDGDERGVGTRPRHRLGDSRRSRCGRLTEPRNLADAEPRARDSQNRVQDQQQRSDGEQQEVRHRRGEPGDPVGVEALERLRDERREVDASRSGRPVPAR